jgi:hypothetical protein
VRLQPDSKLSDGQEWNVELLANGLEVTVASDQGIGAAGAVHWLFRGWPGPRSAWSQSDGFGVHTACPRRQDVEHRHLLLAPV